MEARPAAPDWRIPDDLWELLQEYIPPHPNTHRFGGGRPRTDDRICMDAIFFVLRTGCQWKSLNATVFCPGSTAHDRFQEWTDAGVFHQMWEVGLLAYDDLKGIDWSWLSMDGCMTKAPLAGEKNRAQSDRPGQERRQAQPPGRGPGSAGRRGRRWCQPPRHEDGRVHLGQYPRGSAGSHTAKAARPVHGQRV